MQTTIPRQREAIYEDEKLRKDPFTQRVKIVQMKFWTANRPESLSLFSLRLSEHFPGTKFDCLELCFGNTTISVYRHLNSANQDIYIRPRNMNWKKVEHVLTLHQEEHFGSIEQFFELIRVQFRRISFQQLDIVPGFRKMEVLYNAR